MQFIKKETLAQMFSCEFCKISKNTFLTEHLWATGSVITMNCFLSVEVCLFLNPIQDGEGGKKAPSVSFSHVTSTNVGIGP